MDLRAGSRVWGILAVVGMNALIGCAADPPSIGVQAAALVATPITANPTLKLPPTTTAAIQAAFSEPSTLQSALSLEQRAQTAQDKLQASARTLTALRRDRVVASVAGTPLPDIAAAQSALQKNLKDLAAIETQLDTTYRDGYGLLAKNAKGQAGALTRLALLQFRTSYRRSGPGANDLRVGPLPRAPECTSGPIDGPLLWQFFDPASRAPDNSQTVRVNAVRALAAIQTRLACSSKAAVFDQDRRLVAAFDQLAKTLQSQLLPSVVDVLAAPLLLSFDASKYFGPSVASYRFWRAQAGVVRAGLASEGSVLSWIGVWLADRKSGRLIGLAPTCPDQPSAKPCVKAGVLIESIARPQNLGNGDCSLLEMISRGDGLSGYQCVGSLCGTVDPKLTSAGLPAKATPSCPKGGTSKFGASCDAVQKLCGSANNDLSGHSRSQLCGELRANPNAGRFLCGVEIRKQTDPATAAIRCVAEASGACEGQIDRLTKSLSAQTYAAAGCAAPRGTVRSDGDGYTGPNYADRAATAVEKLEDASSRERIRTAVEGEFGRVSPETFAAAYDNAVSLLTNGVSVVFIEPDGTSAPGTPEREIVDRDGDALYDANSNTIYVDSHAWNDNEAAGRGSANVDTLLHEAIHAMLDFMGLTDSTTEQREHRVISNLSTNRDCAADDPNCSTGCSAQDEQLAALAECTKAPAQPRDPGYVDPLPDDATAPAWSSCFSELGDSVADGQRTCQTVDCAIDRVCDAARGGVCVSDSDVAVPGGFQRACAAVDCADGLPQFDAGRCRCGASYQSVEPRPEIPL